MEGVSSESEIPRAKDDPQIPVTAQEKLMNFVQPTLKARKVGKAAAKFDLIMFAQEGGIYHYIYIYLLLFYFCYYFLF